MKAQKLQLPKMTENSFGIDNFKVMYGDLELKDVLDSFD